MPGFTMALPTSATCSPGLSPLVITQFPLILDPTCTGRGFILLLSFTTNAIYTFCIWLIASCGTNTALGISDDLNRTFTYCPGRNNPVLLGTSACTVIDPVAGSISRLA